MKKNLSTFLSLLLSFFLLPLTGCKSQEKKHQPLNIPGKISLPKKEGIDSFVYIETDQQLNEIARYDTAGIIVSREGCQYCDSLLYSLRGNKDGNGIYSEGYIYRTSSVFYLVDYQTYLTCYSSSYNKEGSYARLFPEVTGTPVLLFYENGKLINSKVGHFFSLPPDRIDKSDGEKNFRNTQSVLSSYLYDTEYYTLNTFTRVQSTASFYNTYYLEDRDEEDDTLGFSTKTLDEKLDQQESRIILYVWRRCKDCKDLKDRLILPYLHSTKKKLYFYELDGYFLKRRSDNPEEKDRGEKLWQDFSFRYHLDDIPGYQNSYGKTGAVPAIIRYAENGIQHETLTFRNDTGLAMDSSGYLSYQTSVYAEIRNLKSPKKSSSEDPASKSYQEALESLNGMRDELELDRIEEFLNGPILP